MNKYILALFFSLSTLVSFSQGDGPHAYMLIPKGVTGVNMKWLNLNQNIITPNIFVPGADIAVDVFPITLFHTFSLGGRYAQAYFMMNPGSFTATATSIPPVIPMPLGTQVKANGFSDGFAGFRVGLAGAPALNVSSFLEEKMQFSLFADARFWYSGTYDATNFVNLGTNRNTFEFSLPMAIPLNKNRARATWLEVSPAIEFFTANNNPSKGNTAKKITQAPLLIIENHLSHNFNKKFWGSISLRYSQGGATTADDKKQDNQTRMLGTAAGLGYQVLPFLGINADYGTIIYGYNGAKSDMLRVAMTFTYANMKKK
jgi:hypothetical protein